MKTKKDCSKEDFSQKAKEAFYYLKNNKDCLEKDLEEKEDMIALCPDYSIEYARVVGSFEKGEAAIAKSARHSAYYAINILKSRFLRGEKEISKSAFYSCAYVLFIMEGEKNDQIHRSMLELGIKEKNSYWVKEYCRYMEYLKGEGDRPYWADKKAAINWF